jgi:hypothetical protein
MELKTRPRCLPGSLNLPAGLLYAGFAYQIADQHFTVGFLIARSQGFVKNQPSAVFTTFHFLVLLG